MSFPDIKSFPGNDLISGNDFISANDFISGTHIFGETDQKLSMHYPKNPVLSGTLHCHKVFM